MYKGGVFKEFIRSSPNSCPFQNFYSFHLTLPMGHSFLKGRAKFLIATDLLDTMSFHCLNFDFQKATPI